MLKWVGLPEESLQAFDTLYTQSRCNIVIKSETFEGFGMFSGVRQGCPLSPLIHAVVAEALLDKLEAEVPQLLVGVRGSPERDISSLRAFGP